MAKKKVNNPYKITPTELIDSKGSFNQNFFYSKDGKWIAVSSEDNGKVLNTIDTFKNVELKKYYCLERHKWIKLFIEKKIWL